MKINKQLIRDVVLGAIALAAFFLIMVDLSIIDGLFQ